MAEKLSISGLSFEELCKNKDITGAVLKDLQAHGKRVGLQKFELPGEIASAESKRGSDVLLVSWILGHRLSSNTNCNSK